jgi:hypothetical protein
MKFTEQSVTRKLCIAVHFGKDRTVTFVTIGSEPAKVGDYRKLWSKLNERIGIQAPEWIVDGIYYE